MTIFSHLTDALRKRKLVKEFRPLGMKKRCTFLVSVPSDDTRAVSTLSFLGGLKTWGQVYVLIPHCVHHFYQWLSQRYYKKIGYPKPVRRFGKERKVLQEQLQNQKFHFLIELNAPVNISLPFVATAEKRICFFDMDNYPYYNIMMKNGYTSLHEFFNVKKANPARIIQFSGKSKTQVRSAYGKHKPLCFVNGVTPHTWTGDTIVVEKDISRTDPDVLSLLNCADAYCGHHDVLYEFACVFKKKIINHD